MPTAFITTWDSYRNETKQHYLPINFREFVPPSGKPIVLHSYTAEVILGEVAKAEGFNPDEWEVLQVTKPDDEHLFVIVKRKQGPIFKSVSLRWHY